MLTLNCPVFVPQFNEEHHRYVNADSVVLPSVTQILSPVSALEYSRVDPGVLREKAELGTAVHECIEYLIDDDIDEDSLVAEWVPYLEAWKSWRATFNPEFVARELRLACDLFAGTIDCVCRINGQLIVIDWKTTEQIMKTVGPQTAAYELLARKHLGADSMLARAVVQLKPNGTFVFKRFDSIEDYEVFESLLKINRWMKEND